METNRKSQLAKAFLDSLRRAGCAYETVSPVMARAKKGLEQLSYESLDSLVALGMTLDRTPDSHESRLTEQEKLI